MVSSTRCRKFGGVARKVGRAAMAWGVERDDQEPHPRQPAEHAHVGAAVEAETMQEDQRNPVTAHGHPDLVSVVEGHHLMRQPDAGSGGSTGYRCLTHIDMVNPAANRAPFRRLCAWLPPWAGVIYTVFTCHSHLLNPPATSADVCATFLTPTAM